MVFTLEDILDAVQYGFDYRVESMNDGKSVPIGNTFVIIIIANKNVATILFFDFVIFLHTSLNLKINIKKKLALKGGNLLVSFHTYIF